MPYLDGSAQMRSCSQTFAECGRPDMLFCRIELLGLCTKPNTDIVCISWLSAVKIQDDRRTKGQIAPPPQDTPHHELHASQLIYNVSHRRIQAIHAYLCSPRHDEGSYTLY
jgi:hypothetical protein